MSEPVLTRAPEAETMTIDELADALRVSKTTAKKLRASGRLPAPIQGLLPSLLRWRRETIREWIAAGCPAQEEEPSR